MFRLSISFSKMEFLTTFFIFRSLFLNTKWKEDILTNIKSFISLRLIQLVLHKQTSWLHFLFKSNIFNGLKKKNYISLTYMSVDNNTSFTKVT